MKTALRALALAATLIVAGCAGPQAPAPTPAPQPVPGETASPVAPPPVTTPQSTQQYANARAAGLTLASPRAFHSDQAIRALQAFRISCPSLIRRQDRSGLARPSDWQAVCSEAARLNPNDAPGFFFHRFDWVRVGDGKAFATGYYEPQIAGSRTRQPGFDVPVYRTPSDLVRCTRPDGGSGRGRITANGTCTLYFTRAEIEDGALAGRGLEIGWAADPVDLFFLQIQGSGQLVAPDGSIIRIGYDNQNGREYVAIGRLLRERGILPLGGADMKAIAAWIRANPDAGRALMRENLSYVFFKELTGAPLGALGLPVTPHATVAADPLFVPLGAPVFLSMERPEASGLWIAQDTGGAIKGANRFDTFWGAGEEATRIAGGMSSPGSALLLLPRGVAARALAQP
ncbi:murein transglycosylase A [Sphingomonas piscis]|uniref:peptidoglycan lytic exotransglycosylase n=1 Tax=Sphingomonas piscis TaxID=2714943 RepID=A0A6G7YLP1_9SPHN|nr:murein transglycosylase A [Sphingomonas piscis]QIK77659.1 murein transglycosylase A [Sphingomonas piscis]